MESNQISPRSRRSKQQIQDLLNEYEKSKLTVIAFCKLHRISAGNFHKWKSRYRDMRVHKKKTSGFAKVDVIDLSKPQMGLFAEIKGIKIFQPVSASFLKELLA
jgi:hypothetical protein